MNDAFSCSLNVVIICSRTDLFRNFVVAVSFFILAPINCTFASSFPMFIVFS